MKFDRKPAPDAAELRRLYVDEGLSLAAIGRQIGMQSSSVLMRLRDAGIPTRPRRSAVTRSDLVACIERGLHLAAISREVGLTDAAVLRQLRRHGLRAPDGHGKRTYPVRDRIQASGYWLLYRPDHPDADKRGRIMEHRLVMEEKIGRRLRPEEVVHHMNHVRDDNRPENLMLLPDQAAHGREHYPKGNAIADGNSARWRKR